MFSINKRYQIVSSCLLILSNILGLWKVNKHHNAHCTVSLITICFYICSTPSIQDMANAIGKEARAIYNYASAHGDFGDQKSISCLAPFVNIMRHPLWGRVQVKILMIKMILLRNLCFICQRPYGKPLNICPCYSLTPASFVYVYLCDLTWNLYQNGRTHNARGKGAFDNLCSVLSLCGI